MRQLSSEEIDEMLVENGVGLLSLVDGDQPYAIPMSFGYDGDDLMIPMQWGSGYDGRKERCVASNPKACFTLYEQDSQSQDTWRSIVITGELQEITDDEKERAFTSLAANATFADDLGVWGVPFEDVDLKLYELLPDEFSGREFSTDASN